MLLNSLNCCNKVRSKALFHKYHNILLFLSLIRGSINSLDQFLGVWWHGFWFDYWSVTLHHMGAGVRTGEKQSQVMLYIIYHGLQQKQHASSSSLHTHRINTTNLPLPLPLMLLLPSLSSYMWNSPNQSGGPQGLSQDIGTGCPKFVFVKFCGILFSREATIF